jgi:MerR family transcriptional regulator, thiopeptide resistance regulator
MADAFWKIGELASRTGISVRTLHHYEEIGLVTASHRTPAGHRLYGREEVARLQQVLSLRALGFSLQEIRGLLEARRMNARQIIDLHLARLRRQIELQQELCSRLQALAAQPDLASAEQIIKTIEVMTMFEKYYTKEQLDTLAKRREMLGEDRMRAAQEEWPRLMQSVRDEMRKGTDPKDPRVAALARRWRELIEEFTGGDAGIEQSLRNMYRQESQFAEQQGFDRELNDYIQRALSS